MKEGRPVLHPNRGRELATLKLAEKKRERIAGKKALLDTWEASKNGYDKEYMSGLRLRIHCAKVQLHNMKV